MPQWLVDVLNRIRQAGYTILECCDGDGDSWENVLYTIVKGDVTYRQNVRGWALNTLPLPELY
jgi:hypothetical protein